MPFEFEADEHSFKDVSGKDVEPIAQELDAGHHGHDDHKDHAMPNTMIIKISTIS